MITKTRIRELNTLGLLPQKPNINRYVIHLDSLNPGKINDML